MLGRIRTSSSATTVRGFQNLLAHLVDPKSVWGIIERAPDGAQGE
jgi:hypothetical protein